MEDRKEVADLAARWLALAGFRVRNALLSLHAAPFGKTAAGLWDFRAVGIEGAVHKVELVDVDLAHSLMGSTGQLGGDLRALGCRFDGCRYQATLDGVFERCTFLGASLTDSTIREAFISCDFTGANLSRVRGSHVAFKGCTFASSNFVKACFYDSHFFACVFENARFGRGSLAGCTFEDCRFVGVDWGDTILLRVSGIP
jgi:fluoroquinolone resistance protein